MARRLRFQYPGAVYHIMAHGDGGKSIFSGKEDHLSFLYWLEQVKLGLKLGHRGIEEKVLARVAADGCLQEEGGLDMHRCFPGPWVGLAASLRAMPTGYLEAS